MTRILSRLFIFVAALFFLQTGQSQSNQYLHFDGVDDFAILNNAAQYVEGASGVSMTGWFYTDALVYGQGMIGLRGPGAGEGEMYVIQLNNGTLECRFISSGGFHEFVGPAGTAQAGVWQHLAWVYTGTAIQLYIDGTLIGSSQADGFIASSEIPLGIGKSILSGYNFVFGGRIDEVTLWSKGLTQADIQDMMLNELVGDEPFLEAYYKMNQGIPGADNTSISQLISVVGGGDRNATLMNFAMTGETSNFNGVLVAGFQSISFPQISDKLISTPPFTLSATASSGLPLEYTVVSGPASLVGDEMTLDGTPGTVTVRASQAGDDDWDPADDVEVSFDVVDPATLYPSVEIRNPVEGSFYAPTLSPILLASIVDVAYPTLFNITDIVYDVDGTVIAVTDYGNTHQTAWWTPDAYGTHTLNVTATHNEGTSYTASVTFDITATVDDLTAVATSNVWANVDDFTVEVEAELPSYQGAFDHIQGMLAITCPPGGCDPWDRVSSIEVRGHNGEWYEIIRYLTPYGVACNHEIDLTDFTSLLQGKVRFRVNLGTQGNGFLYSLDLEYQAGEPEYAYSTVEKLWYQTYSFGDMANLQPTEYLLANYPDNTEASKLKVVSSGHGWGDNNTGNAAEFHHDIHHIWVNGTQTFEQDNWYDCNPNPDGCSPQNGTWFYDRAGWCPGSIAQFFDYDMSPYVGTAVVPLQYIFNEDYVDLCHPNNPNCVSGVTCANCNDGFNPHLIVTSYLISLGNEPLADAEVTVGIEELTIEKTIDFNVYPNPSAGRFMVDLKEFPKKSQVFVYDQEGRLVSQMTSTQGSPSLSMDINEAGSGIYIIKVISADGVGVRKLIIE
jgi:hypothetical protein